MKLFKIKFKLSGHVKEKNKVGTDEASAFWKIQIQYMRANKPPEFISAELLEDYGNFQFEPGFGAEYEKQCDELRGRIIREESACQNKETLAY